MRRPEKSPQGASGAAERRVLLLLLPRVHALDFAGPVQAIYEANGMGARYALHYVGEAGKIPTAQGFSIAGVEPLPAIEPTDWVMVPGTESASLPQLEVPSAWLRQALARAARVSSVCSGAFALAKAGLLDGRTCTTHWKVTDLLREWTPSARVLENNLFARDGKIVTSAGEASGIDMTLAMIEEDWGPEIAARVAREMVVYVRRSAESAQSSIYLEHREHTHPGVHRVQDWIISNPDQSATIDAMAGVAGVSSRHLTRIFKASTGVTLKNFAHKVKLEVAQQLLSHSTLTPDEIASRCGFADVRQLRRLWRQHFGASLGSASRSRRERVA